ncbi:NAD-dependent epimerase/dehydratase family protein [Leeuwenhoekiella sp. MAR_2009_132]|uniref:NAD-dependent epimerase/dehydratase family protein n=1 Tax=Leeuwenhoekiella sp. MAR_2009_132 TaxID=1392489 RepID=UPI00048B9BC3|nr:NAD-dependent epimerase/dehydratase family protein [Leeuwenhoekiella sp. MAR_2009_132]
MKEPKILITGAFGQLGTALTDALISKYGSDAVVATDLHIREGFSCKTLKLDATDIQALDEVVRQQKITQIYHLAAILSAKGEEKPLQTWDLNNSTFFNVLEVARLNAIKKVFFPSSIAVFGPDARKEYVSHDFALHPTTVYGISKVAGEHWARYYNAKYDLDVRCLRYPGLISYQSFPGGGTTDYAVDIFHKAINGENFVSYLQEDTQLPMLYMDDAIEATLQLMEAPKEAIKTVGYNIQGISFSPKELLEAIQKHIPEFKAAYKPDHRQAIAESWPISLDDRAAQAEWGWKPKYDLAKMTQEMLKQLELKKNNSQKQHA